MKKTDPAVDEAIQTLNMKDGPSRRKLLTGTGLVSATAAASALLAACSSSSSASSRQRRVDGVGRRWRHRELPEDPPVAVLVRQPRHHELFFVPTQFGFSDAAALLGLPKPKWGGSKNSIPSEMVTPDTAISAKAAGIATCVINSKPSDTTFATPVAAAMNAGIPVVSYNADGPIINGVGDAGHQPALLRRPGALPVRPADGRAHQVAGQAGQDRHLHRDPGQRQHPAALRRGRLRARLGGLPGQDGGHRHDDRPRPPAEKAFFTGNQEITGAFAVDAGSTEVLGAQLASSGLAGKIPAGGFDLTPGTLTAINAGQLDFTIDQDPYLQGFLPVLYLYLFNLTGGLVLPPDTDTGLTFITRSTIGPYLSTKTTYGAPPGRTRPRLCPAAARSTTQSRPQAPDLPIAMKSA